MRSNINLIILLSTLSLLIVSCTVFEKTNKEITFLNQVCGNKTIEDILLTNNLYSTIAKENEVEALITFQIKCQEKIFIKILDEQYYKNNKLLPINTDFNLGNGFNIKLEKALNEKCGPLEVRTYSLIIAYKIEGSNFKPSKKTYHILKEEKPVETIHISSH